MDFDAIITGIRKAIYGREVREYIASSMEWTRDFVNQSIANIKELLRQAEAARDAAKASQDAAKVSETNAKASENAARASQNAAASSASAAAGSASAAKTSETNAKASENAAKTSETKAKTSETNAKASENAAKTSETNAKTSETNAKSSETKAATSEANAKTRETKAKASADSMGDKFKSIKTDWNSVTDKPSSYPPSAHSHSAANITSGILGLARGGTGCSTALDACKTLLWRDYLSGAPNWDALDTGIWLTTPEHWGTNGPSGVYKYGIVMVWNYSDNVTQVYIAHCTGVMAFRQRWTNGNSFSGWAYVNTNTITSQTSDPGAGSSLATGSILLVYA